MVTAKRLRQTPRGKSRLMTATTTSGIGHRISRANPTTTNRRGEHPRMRPRDRSEGGSTRASRSEGERVRTSSGSEVSLASLSGWSTRDIEVALAANDAPPRHALGPSMDLNGDVDSEADADAARLSAARTASLMQREASRGSSKQSSPKQTPRPPPGSPPTVAGKSRQQAATPVERRVSGSSPAIAVDKPCASPGCASGRARPAARRVDLGARRRELDWSVAMFVQLGLFLGIVVIGLGLGGLWDSMRVQAVR